MVKRGFDDSLRLVLLGLLAAALLARLILFFAQGLTAVLHFGVEDALPLGALLTVVTSSVLLFSVLFFPDWAWRLLSMGKRAHMDFASAVPAEGYSVGVLLASVSFVGLAASDFILVYFSGRAALGVSVTIDLWVHAASALVGGIFLCGGLIVSRRGEAVASEGDVEHVSARVLVAISLRLSSLFVLTGMLIKLPADIEWIDSNGEVSPVLASAALLVLLSTALWLAPRLKIFSGIKSLEHASLIKITVGALCVWLFLNGLADALYWLGQLLICAPDCQPPGYLGAVRGVYWSSLIASLFQIVAAGGLWVFREKLCRTLSVGCSDP